MKSRANKNKVILAGIQPFFSPTSNPNDSTISKEYKEKTIALIDTAINALEE